MKKVIIIILICNSVLFGETFWFDFLDDTESTCKVDNWFNLEENYLTTRLDFKTHNSPLFLVRRIMFDYKTKEAALYFDHTIMDGKVILYNTYIEFIPDKSILLDGNEIGSIDFYFYGQTFCYCFEFGLKTEENHEKYAEILQKNALNNTSVLLVSHLYEFDGVYYRSGQ